MKNFVYVFHIAATVKSTLRTFYSRFRTHCSSFWPSDRWYEFWVGRY